MGEWLMFIWLHLKCLLGYHAPGEYHGKIRITHIDKETHKIEYGNVKECPTCGKPLSVDFW